MAEQVRITKDGAYVELVGASGAMLVSKDGAYAELAGSGRSGGSEQITVLGVYAEMDPHAAESILVTAAGAYAEIERTQARISQLSAYAELSPLDGPFVTTAGAYAEIEPIQARVTQLGAYLEVETQIGLFVTAAGAYTEVEPFSNRVTKLGAYGELDGLGLQVSVVGAYGEMGGQSVQITQSGAYGEMGGNAAFVTDAGAYGEIQFPDLPVRLCDGLDIIYAGNSLRDYISTFDLATTIKINGADNFIAQGLQAAGLSSWECNLSGVWAKALDDIFGEEVAERGNSDALYDCKILLGRWSNQVGYFWLLVSGNGAFVKMYRTKVSIDNVMLFDATLALSGAPERGTSG
ncbi:MAG: hypothetical protein U0350_36410 [Caldilineaceae bacterium]